VILHLFHDEKFTAGIIDFFEKLYPKANNYVVITSAKGRLKYPDPLCRVQVVCYKSNSFKQLLASVADYDAIFLHYLDKFKAELINSSPNYDRFVWMIWGGDAYKLFDIKLHDEETEIVNRKSQEPFWLFKGLKNTALGDKLFGKSSTNHDRLIFDAIRKIRYCTTILPCEYDLFKANLPLSAIYIPFSYGLKEFNQKGRQHADTNERINILVGNSGYPSNNHMTALRLLSRLELGKRKVIVPLSYGPNRYIEEVIKGGKQILLHAFAPITEFLSFDEYYKLVSGCSVCIMNHYRQQGMGNIIILLWLGARLYMRSENIAFQYLIENGAIVFPIDGDEISLDPLTEDQKEQNRSVMERLYNHDLIIEKARNLIKIVTSGSNPIN